MVGYLPVCQDSAIIRETGKSQCWKDVNIKWRGVEECTLILALHSAYPGRLHTDTGRHRGHSLFLFHHARQVLDHHRLAVSTARAQVCQDGLEPRLVRSDTDIDGPVATVWQVLYQGGKLPADVGGFRMDKR